MFTQHLLRRRIVLLEICSMLLGHLTMLTMEVVWDCHLHLCRLVDLYKQVNY